MNRAMIFLAASVTALALAACDKPAETKPDDTASKNATTTNGTTTAQPVQTAQPAAEPVTIAETDLSTPADFEETAEKAISKANYKAELATLEGDIAKE